MNLYFTAYKCSMLHKLNLFFRALCGFVNILFLIATTISLFRYCMNSRPNFYLVVFFLSYGCFATFFFLFTVKKADSFLVYAVFFLLTGGFLFLQGASHICLVLNLFCGVAVVLYLVTCTWQNKKAKQEDADSLYSACAEEEIQSYGCHIKLATKLACWFKDTLPFVTRQRMIKEVERAKEDCKIDLYYIEELDRQKQLNQKLSQERDYYYSRYLAEKETNSRLSKTCSPVSGGNFDFFEGCSSENLLKKRYNKLVFAYHPDNMHGNDAVMQEINRQYQKKLKKFK